MIRLAIVYIMLGPLDSTKGSVIRVKQDLYKLLVRSAWQKQLP